MDGDLDTLMEHKRCLETLRDHIVEATMNVIIFILKIIFYRISI